MPNCFEYESKKGQIHAEPDADRLHGGRDPERRRPRRAARRGTANGTYYTGKPASLSGDVVVLDPGGSNGVEVHRNDTFNSAANPGMVIM